MPCVFGIDFAKTQDFVAAALLFRRNGEYMAMHHSWVCKRSNDLPRIRAPLDEWEQMGILEYVDDVEIHPSIVCDWIYEQMADYDVLGGAIDFYRHTTFMRALGEIGFSAKEKTVKLARPSDLMQVQPVINSAFLNGTIAWGEDPMMRWYTNNVKLVASAHGNYSYEKIEPKSRKTDGFMALAAAFTVADQLPENLRDRVHGTRRSKKGGDAVGLLGVLSLRVAPEMKPAAAAGEWFRRMLPLPPTSSCARWKRRYRTRRTP